MGPGDVGHGDGCLAGGQIRFVDDLTHQARGRVDIGFCPRSSRRIRVTSWRNHTYLVGHKEAVLLGHEVEVPRVPGGDDRLADDHRLRHGQTESFGTVQRHIGIGAGHQCIALALGHVVVDEHDVGSVGCSQPNPFAVQRLQVAVHRLDDQHRAFTG